MSTFSFWNILESPVTKGRKPDHSFVLNWCVIWTKVTEIAMLYIRLSVRQVNNLDFFLFLLTFNNQGHIATGSLRVEEPVYTSWSRFFTVTHHASASNYQLSNMQSPV